ncbi:unnamed protein product [Adineta steineri]|uniref:SH3 domain-containing protein n=1 Tax=Adineta steineri TaxID=433720 RepID=A0A820ET77_9BILA|nr:unnamed protein product [Adineta steineri]CAF0942912.1 unnamed protein product [Adineta steineri]CAF0968409.1 unnamed protein product [Adineta steineri]CAF3625968.1 unnamed protein product [Adineta steineri]CAF4069973.1 unnamed protein product [Adineta steineri]
MCLAIIRLFIILGIALAVREAADVLCLQKQPIHSCASMSCRVISSAVTSEHYPCDCFETEKVLGKKRKWYKIELPDAKHGYVTDDNCSGKVPPCK